MITLRLPVPPSVNVYWRSRVIKARATGKWMSMTYISNEAKAYKEEVGWLAKAAGIREPIYGRVIVGLDYYPKRPQDWQKRARIDQNGWDDTILAKDLDNLLKAILDALKGIVIVDDCWVWEIHARRMEPDGEARVIVTITPIVVVAVQKELM